jgi:hypothetical protein
VSLKDGRTKCRIYKDRLKTRVHSVSGRCHGYCGLRDSEEDENYPNCPYNKKGFIMLRIAKDIRKNRMIQDAEEETSIRRNPIMQEAIEGPKYSINMKVAVAIVTIIGLFIGIKMMGG